MRVREASYTPGTDALRRIGPLLLRAQDLTATALVRLTALDNSAYTSVTGSRASLELLASVVSSASLAAYGEIYKTVDNAERIPITDMPLEKLAAINDWSVEGRVMTSPD